MKHLKKKVAVSLVAMILLVSSVTAYASTPRWSYLTMITANMEVNGNNKAEITVACDADIFDVNKMEAKCELQQLDGRWKTIKTWNETSNDSGILFTKEYAIAKNYSYRLKVTASAYWDSIFLESATEYFDYGIYE